jgi:hypothetical protein
MGVRVSMTAFVPMLSPAITFTHTNLSAVSTTGMSSDRVSWYRGLQEEHESLVDAT